MRDEPAPELAARIEPRLAWIFGGPRTGSTWLLELLTHPLRPTPSTPTAVAQPGGGAPWRRAARRLRPGAAAAIPIDEPYLAQHLEPLLVIRSDPGDLSKPAMMTLNETRENDPSYFFNEQFAEAWRPPLRTLILRRFAAQVDLFEREHGRNELPVVIKEPNGSYGAELLLSLLPGSRMIFLLRDPRDVIDSFLDAMTPGGWLADKPYMRTLATADDRLHFARTEARSWLERTLAVRRAYDAHPPERRYRLRYEDLRADTESALSSLCEWMGSPRSARELHAAAKSNSFEAIPAADRGRGKVRRSATPGLWRERLSAAEQAAIEEIAGPTINELGY